jgi:hypothetical protein
MVNFVVRLLMTLLRRLSSKNPLRGFFLKPLVFFFKISSKIYFPTRFFSIMLVKIDLAYFQQLVKISQYLVKG